MSFSKTFFFNPSLKSLAQHSPIFPVGLYLSEFARITRLIARLGLALSKLTASNLRSEKKSNLIGKNIEKNVSPKGNTAQHLLFGLSHKTYP